MSFEVYFDSPENYKSKYNFYAEGCSPKLLAKLIELLETGGANLREASLAFYLFNNKILYEKLLELAGAGVKVNVVTIPPEGYDNSNPKFIVDRATGHEINYATKYDLAREIFADCYRKPHPNLRLLFFPHQYIRSARAKAFARGELPYSLHLKSFLLTMKDGSGITGLTSSNFAVRDLIKEEVMVVVKDEPDYVDASKCFFADLIEQAIDIRNYDFKRDYCDFEISAKTHPGNGFSGFIGPFYFNSPFQMEDAIIEKLKNSRSRIWFCGQHVCPIGYEFDGAFHSSYPDQKIKREGMLNHIIAKAKAGVDVLFISQTFVPNGSSTDRQPANRKAFKEFFAAIEHIPNIRYYVNENMHAKFILIDDEVIVSTFNYTPSQFIYLDKVEIESFESCPGKSYKGIYSEVGQYMMVKEPAAVKKFHRYSEEIIRSKASVKKL